MPFARVSDSATVTHTVVRGDEEAACGQVVESYLGMLCEEGFVSDFERERLQTALSGLLKCYPDVSAAAVRAVRNEMARPENNKYILRDKEARFWEQARKRGHAPIPGYGIEDGLEYFLVNPEDDPGRTVVFLRPEYEHPVEPYVPSCLRMGEVFYHVVLRMFRRHLQR